MLISNTLSHTPHTHIHAHTPTDHQHEWDEFNCQPTTRWRAQTKMEGTCKHTHTYTHPHTTHYAPTRTKHAQHPPSRTTLLLLTQRRLFPSLSTSPNTIMSTPLSPPTLSLWNLWRSALSSSVSRIDRQKDLFIHLLFLPSIHLLSTQKSIIHSIDLSANLSINGWHPFSHSCCIQ